MHEDYLLISNVGVLLIDGENILIIGTSDIDNIYCITLTISNQSTDLIIQKILETDLTLIGCKNECCSP